MGKRSSWVVAVLVLAIVAAVVGCAPKRGAVAAPAFERLSGPDRAATAAAVSRATFDPGVAAVFVATGASFPDALAGGAAAAKRGGPVLLVTRDGVPAATADELDRLKPGSIVVLGGPTVVSDAVVAALGPHTTGSVTRIAGGDRFETAAAVSKATFSAGVGAVYVANGGSFADALAGGPAAGVAGGPVLLVARDAIPPATADELRRLSPRSIVVLGGPAVVSAAVESQLHSFAGSVGRSAGDDRYATSVAVSVNGFGAGVTTVFLATGSNFPDALAGGPAGAHERAPILLVGSDCVPKVVNDELDRLAPSRVVLLGGPSAVGPGVEARTPCPVVGSPRTPEVSASNGPAWDDDGPDPDLVRFGSTYYAYTTGTTWGNHIGVLVSDRPDGGWHTVNGKPFGSSALPSFPGWQKPDTQTSPGVFAWGGRYVMFYDAVVPSHGKYCLSVAVSAKPEGPFTDGSTGPLVCQADLGGSIDPTPFVDGSGKPWLLWKSNDGSSASVSQVWAAPLHDDGVSLAASPVSVMPKDDVNHPGQNTVDDPHLVVIDGVHYLFFSGGDWESPRYAVWYAVCDGPTGPCSQPRRDPILASYGNVAGPGGGNVVDDGAGRYWLSYQGWDPGCTAYACGGKRKLFVAPLNFR